MWDVLLQNLPTVFLIILALFFCGAEIIKAYHVWKDEHDKKIKGEVAKQQKEIDIQAEFDKLHIRLDKIEVRLNGLEGRIAAAEKKLEDLTESDMHDIKSWIVEQYHKFYVQQGWIDAFSAETLDKRYSDYKKEGGNSYIGTLMDQLHTLSMDPEHSIHKKIK